jgi:hypothetical protein
LEIEGTKVSGRWEDKINSLGGIVRGDVTENGFEVMLGGQFFQAKGSGLRMRAAGDGLAAALELLPSALGRPAQVLTHAA